MTKIYKDIKGADIDSELVADLVGDYLFTDADFVKNLFVANRNVFQKIYDEIKYFCKIATAGSKEARQLEKVKKIFDQAYQKKGAMPSETKYSLEQIDGVEYVRAEKDIFVKEDGTPASEREVFNSLVGKTISLLDGDVKIVKRLPGKDMYNELSKRYPKYLGAVEDVKQLNSEVNYNLEELLSNSGATTINEADKDNRHARQGIISFDTRTVKFYDGSKAYNIEFSIATLQSGEKIAYAKKYFGFNADLTKKIQTAEVRSNQSPLNQQSATNIISQKSEKSTEDSKNFFVQAEKDGNQNKNGDLPLSQENTASGVVKYSLSGNKTINVLTGEELDGSTYKVLERLSKGEDVSLEEITNLKEVQYGEQIANKMAEDFISQHPELDYISINDVGTYMLNTNERIQLRDKIISERLQEGSFSGIDKNGNEVYNGNVVKGNRLDVVIGLPGSGKSSSIVNPLSQFCQSIVIDSDIIKRRIPEFNDGLGGSLVHEESSKINTKLLIESLKLGNNIVLPIVGSKVGSVERYINLAKERGYDVNVHLNELPNGKALGRVLKRYFDEGRFISPEYVLSLGNKPTDVYEQIMQRSDINGYSRWNNDVTKGQRPILTEISESNKLYAQYSASWRTRNRSDVGRSNSRSTSRETRQIAPIKETSSTDDVFFGKKKEPTRYSLSPIGETPKHYGNYNVSGKDLAIAPAQEFAPVKQDDTGSKKLSFTETFKQSVLKRFGMEKLGGYVYAQQQVRRNLPDSFFKPVTNAETGMVVNITPKGINETFGPQTYGRIPQALKIAKLATVELIPEAIEKGTVRFDDQSNYHDENSPIRYAYIYYDTEVEGQPCQLKIDVRKSKKSETNRLHVHSVILENKKADDRTVDATENGHGHKYHQQEQVYHTNEDLSSVFLGKNSEEDIDPVAEQGSVPSKNYLSMEDFMNADASVWRNVEYDDEATQKRIAQHTHRTMVEEGAIVKVTEDVQKNVGQSYPDLRGMKKKERLPLLKESMNALKRNLRNFLDGFKNQSFEFEVNGKVLEAKLYNTGINEVLEKVTQEKANMLYTTAEIFKNSRYLYSTSDYDSDPNVYRWNYFYTPVQIGEETAGVRIAVRDTANPAESQIYNWGIKKDASLGDVRRGTNNRISHGASSDASIDSISQDLGPVKEPSEISQAIGPVAEGKYRWFLRSSIHEGSNLNIYCLEVMNMKHLIRKTISGFLCILLIVSFCVSIHAQGEAQETVGRPAVSCKSAILMEASTGTVLFEQNPDEALPPASVTKVMTLLLVMEAIEGGKMQYSDMLSASAHACSMGGSQIYLEEGEQMSVEDLIKSVVISSANDAAVVLAEAVSGTEDAFVEAMNAKARVLGMEKTHFENTNGLDDTATNHVTSARDIAIMSRELIRYPKILEYSSIWMDTIRNGEFGLTNTNRLVRFYKGATGLKTGSTSKAGFCISATAERENMSLICVIMGAESRDIRNAAATSLLDWGFANYARYNSTNPYQSEVPILGGVQDRCRVYGESFSTIAKKGEISNIKAEVKVPDHLSAPIEKGQKVGTIEYVLEGKKIGEVDVLADETVEKINFWGILAQILKYMSFHP